MLSYVGAGRGNMLTCCHREMMKSGHACVLTCRQAPQRRREQVFWLFVVVGGLSRLRICGHMCCREKVHPFERSLF